MLRTTASTHTVSGRCWRASSLCFRSFARDLSGSAARSISSGGSFDLAVTRFSGRRAPERPGADKIAREAYSHEVISVGWWPGDGEIIKDAAFYAYAAPEPAGFKESATRPAKAFYSPQKGEFFLRYDDVRASASPERDLLAFCESTYEAGANAGEWNRAELERAPR